MNVVARRSPASVLAVSSLALLVAACGGGDPQTADGAEEVVEEYVEAFADGDGDACELLTDDYAEELVDEWNSSGFGEEEENCDDVIEAGAVFVEAFGSDGFEIADIDGARDGSRATVEVEYEGEDFGSETYQLVYEDDEWLIDGEGDADDEGSDDLDFGDETAAEPEPTEETTTPVAVPSALGSLGTLGDWEVRVTEVEGATDLITKPRYYNARPREDYLLVTFEATYVGTDRSADVDSDLSWTLTTADQQVHEEAAATTPADAQAWPTEARSGGTVTGQAVFDVDPTQLTGALVSAETYTAAGEEEYVDFTL